MGSCASAIKLVRERSKKVRIAKFIVKEDIFVLLALDEKVLILSSNRIMITLQRLSASSMQESNLTKSL